MRPHISRLNDETLKRVHRFVCQYTRQFGYGPSLREIGRACYMSSSTAVRYLDRLEADGRIMREPTRARAITILIPYSE